MSDVNFTHAFEDTDLAFDSASGFENHIYGLSRQIARCYFDVRRFHIVKCLNIEQRGR